MQATKTLLTTDAKTPAAATAAATVLRTATESKYCAVGLYVAGKDDPSLMMFHGRVILFDTRVIAQQFLPILGGGRTTIWCKGGESAKWLEIQPGAPTRAVILTGYDPYHLPAGMPGHLRSESPGREWKHHLMWSAWMSDCGGNFVRRKDGSYANVAAGEEVW